MASRVAVVICATSFLLGVLCTHWTADALTRWKPPSARADAHFWTAAAYYRTLAHAPPVAALVLGGAATLGVASVCVGLFKGDATDLMFDGASTLLYAVAIGVYALHVFPTLFTHFYAFPVTPPDPSNPFPSFHKPEILKLADAHLICSVVLTGVLVLQAARWWSLSDDEDGPVMGPASEADGARPAKEEKSS
ncbi:Shr3 amino acid permease chaperone [Vararia minispora EC-137]|uniref:Shr3 amino acid permease chaperone n=1 Tax=Vararia minispora EC-137 TaxID=1314806 RepID=A0ACB8QIY1_9AGAM|nr:Shr3 amino acid permease chaperone [Vararia minispora EC-137]